MLVQLTPLQARVIGVLIEKEITTPEQYPLSLNAITLGCNQKSSRDPIYSLSENEVQNILDELACKNLLFEHRSNASRVLKYKHRFCNTEFTSLKFTPQALAIVCVLLLRGPQTPGEVRTRTNRLAQFSNVNEVEALLIELGDYNGEKLVVKLSKEPGKRESRFAHVLGDNENQAANENIPALSQNKMPADDMKDELCKAQARISLLEAQVLNLTQRLADINA